MPVTPLRVAAGAVVTILVLLLVVFLGQGLSLWLLSGALDREAIAIEGYYREHLRHPVRSLLAEPVRRQGAATVCVVPGAVFDAARGIDVRMRVRAELDVAPDTCLFVYVGALGVANGLQTLLEAVVEVAGDERMSFVVVGDGSDRRRLEHEVEHRRIPRVRILPPVPKERVPDILAASDVCLHLLRPDPLFAGALPSKVLEYLGAHRPFITTVPGVPERLAAESGGGFAASPEQLVAELRRWAAMEPDARKVRGEQAFQYGLENFSLAVNVSRLESALVQAMLSP
jgi:glycosyltransferase involved in cell wall biosynthesis